MKADEKERLREKDGFRTWAETALHESRSMLWHLEIDAQPTDLAQQRALTEEFLTRWRKHDLGNIREKLDELAIPQSAWFGWGARRAVLFPDRNFGVLADTHNHASVCLLAASLGCHLPTVWEAVRLFASMREPFNPVRENAVVIPCSQVCEYGCYYYLMITAETHNDEEGDLVVDKWVMNFVSVSQLDTPVHTRWLFVQDPSVGFIEGWLRRR